MKKILFVCSQNRLRSPTAEQIFSTRTDLEVMSAGLDNSAVNVVTPELVQWADIIFVMEKAHRNKLGKKFKAYLNKQRLICLNIPDIYSYMDPNLVNILKNSVPKHLV